jgi:methionine-rich copper-binding protein CopC
MHIQIPARVRNCVRLALAALFTIATTHAVAADSNLAAFAAENDAAMTQMMSGMNIKPSGDIDRDFAAMMIPHHQGAIDMARAELRYGKNEQLRRIAQEIIIDQLQEIGAMRMASNQTLPPMAPAPTQVPAPPPAPPSSTHGSMHLEHSN